MKNPLDYIMGVEEAGEIWGLSPGYIKNLCAAGKIKAKKIGKTWVIDKTQPNPREDRIMTEKPDTREEIMAAVEAIENYTFEQAMKEYKKLEFEKPHFHTVHLTIAPDGSSVYLDSYSSPEYSSKMVASQPFKPYMEDREFYMERFKAAKHELLEELKIRGEDILTGEDIKKINDRIKEIR